MVSHWPQSWGQMAQVSYGSHTWFGHTEQTPQSVLQEAQVSLLLHRPSPQFGHAPQSSGQVKQSSVNESQLLLPQVSQAPQSGAQLRQSSGSLQYPSPQNSHTPQSPGQDEHDSFGSQTLLPQVSHKPQSIGQLSQVSNPGSQ